MKFFLGVDVGGSKSHALVVSEDGQILGFGQAGCGNWESIGYEGLAEVLRTITGQALQRASLDPGQISGAGFGISGFDWPSQLDKNIQTIRSLEFTCPVGLVNDTLVGLLAGAEKAWGVAVVAGTGCNCWGQDQNGKLGRIIGEGELFAEEGGAGSLVTRAIQAISKQWSRRGPATKLTQAFLEKTGLKDPIDLFEGLALRKILLTAEDVLLVFRVADDGDWVAQEIVEWAGKQLADLACGVIRQLSLEDKAFEVVEVGSLWKSGPRLRDAFHLGVQQIAPMAVTIPLQAPPVIGGVVLGMQQAYSYDPGIRRILIEHFMTKRVTFFT